jgi:ABC-2 type transport system ATP-binding protein
VLVESSPDEAVAELAGKIWKKTLAAGESAEGYPNLVSSHLIAGLTQIRVFGEESPGDGFTPVEAGLEDVYFLKLKQAVVN